MPKWHAVVFDLDDTLYPERDYVLSGFRAVARLAAKRFGIPLREGYAALQRLHTAGIRGDTFDRWLAQFGRRPELVACLVEAYRAHRPRISAFPGVADLLSELRQRCLLGLLSDGYVTVQRLKLNALGLADRFDAVVFSDELGREHWKPSPMPFAVIGERLGVAPGEMVYVADNPRKDFLGARASGLASVWCRHAGGDYALLEPQSAAHAPDRTTESLAELRMVLLASVGELPEAELKLRRCTVGTETPLGS